MVWLKWVLQWFWSRFRALPIEVVSNCIFEQGGKHISHTKGKPNINRFYIRNFWKGTFPCFQMSYSLQYSFNSYQCQGSQFFIQTKIDCISGNLKYENTVPSCFGSHWSNCQYRCNPQRDTSWCGIYCNPKWHPTEGFQIILDPERTRSYLRTTMRNEGMYIWII